MIANFFQSLERNGVEHLLISGQATVLYGAATFSEDIDLWINPAEANRDRLLLALHDCRARFYKLTPAPTVENLRRGHGFHFLLPGDRTGELFLDVMGNRGSREGREEKRRGKAGAAAGILAVGSGQGAVVSWQLKKG